MKRAIWKKLEVASFVKKKLTQSFSVISIISQVTAHTGEVQYMQSNTGRLLWTLKGPAEGVSMCMWIIAGFQFLPKVRITL